MVFANLTLLMLAVVFIVDLSGWTDTWKRWLSLWLGIPVGRVRPFDCSLCSTFWLGSLYLLIVRALTLPNFAAVCLLAWLAAPTADLLTALRYGITTAIELIKRFIDNAYKD